MPHPGPATSEGNAEKLGDVTPSVNTAHESLAAIEALEGKQGSTKALGEAFDAYQAAAVDAARTMLAKTGGDGAGKVTAMQST